MRVCPWCEMEVYDDPESGQPETVCPYCENDMGDYRTIPVSLTNEEEARTESVSKPASGGLSKNRLKSEWFGDLEVEDIDEDEADELLDDELIDEFEEDPMWGNYDRVARKLQDTSDETWSCSNCNETMVQVGEQLVGSSEWNGRKPNGWKHPLLSAPFKMSVWLCPGCFRMEQALSESDRDELLTQWNDHGMT